MVVAAPTANLADAREERWMTQVALPRRLLPEEVAKRALSCCQRQRHDPGQSFTIDGAHLSGTAGNGYQSFLKIFCDSLRFQNTAALKPLIGQQDQPVLPVRRSKGGAKQTTAISN